MTIRIILSTLLIIFCAQAGAADVTPPSDPAAVRAALQYENYDPEMVAAIVTASDLPDYNKEAMLAGLENFEGNPDAIKAILAQIQEAMQLD